MTKTIKYSDTRFSIAVQFPYYAFLQSLLSIMQKYDKEKTELLKYAVMLKKLKRRSIKTRERQLNIKPLRKLVYNPQEIGFCIFFPRLRPKL